MELLVTGGTLLLVAALEAEVVASVAVPVGQDGGLGAGTAGVGAGRDEADATRLERGGAVDLQPALEEAGVVVHVVGDGARRAEGLTVEPVGREAARAAADVLGGPLEEWPTVPAGLQSCSLARRQAVTRTL